jgi:type IV secretory pathway TrbD component
MPKERIFTPQQVLVATLLGGPAAGVYTLSANSNSVEGAERTLPLIITGWATAAVYLLALPFLPPLLGLGVLWPLFCGLAYYVAKKSNFPRQLMKQGKLYRHHDMTRALIVGVAGLVVVGLVEAVWFNVIAR